MLAVPMLKNSMMGLLGNPMAPHAAELFESIATGYKFMFDQWAATTMISNVMGMGANPLFVPPVFAPGPVLGGFGFGPPGCLV